MEQSDATRDHTRWERHPVLEVSAVFLRMGLTAFGGPAAHIGMFRHEVVERRKWVSDDQFLDLLGATNLIPGPNSTEMAIHLGYLRAGWAGLLAGGIAFTLPAMLIVMVFSWLYVRYGSTPQADALLYGIKPVMVAIIAQAMWELGRKGIKGPLTLLVAAGAFGLYFLTINELLLLLTGGLVVMLVQNRSRLRSMLRKNTALFITPLFAAATAPVPFSLGLMFLTFLKIGAVLYGSGYVLIAFLRADFVDRLGWITEQQLLDAITIGQITPGPLFTSATFIGYLLGGVPAALLATLAIFLPSYVFVAFSNPLIPRLRGSPWFGPLLDGVIAASLGLIAGVTVQLGRASLVDLTTILIFGVTLFILFRFKINSTWLVIAGAVIGLIVSLMK